MIMHFIGYRKSSTDQAPIHLDQTSRFQHTYAIGQTGAGKSTWATNSFHQDVYNGFGACYFDFHGQDAPWLLDRIPADRIRDVIYLDATNPHEAIGYNVLDGIVPADYGTFTDEIVSSLRHIHQASWGARMDDILTNAIRPLFDLPPNSKGSILGAVRMLNDPFYRNWVVKQCPEKTVRDFWLMEYAGWSKNDQAHESQFVTQQDTAVSVVTGTAAYSGPAKNAYGCRAFYPKRADHHSELEQVAARCGECERAGLTDFVSPDL